MKVTAKATRSGGWWAIEVPEVPGVFTQAKRLDQIAAQVIDAVALMEDIDPADVEVDVDPTLPEDLNEVLASALVDRMQAKELERHASESIAGVASALSADGLPMRDIAAILGVSHQRVGQLTKSHPASAASA